MCVKYLANPIPKNPRIPGLDLNPVPSRNEIPRNARHCSPPPFSGSRSWQQNSSSLFLVGACSWLARVLTTESDFSFEAKVFLSSISNISFLWISYFRIFGRTFWTPQLKYFIGFTAELAILRKYFLFPFSYALAISISTSFIRTY